MSTVAAPLVASTAVKLATKYRVVYVDPDTGIVVAPPTRELNVVFNADACVTYADKFRENFRLERIETHET